MFMVPSLVVQVIEQIVLDYRLSLVDNSNVEIVDISVDNVIHGPEG